MGNHCHRGVHVTLNAVADADHGIEGSNKQYADAKRFDGKKAKERVSGNAVEEVIKYEMIQMGDLMKL